MPAASTIRAIAFYIALPEDQLQPIRIELPLVEAHPTVAPPELGHADLDFAALARETDALVEGHRPPKVLDR